MAFATTKSAGMNNNTNNSNSSAIVIDTESIFKMDQYGIKPQQYVEEEFKFTDTGFTNVKSKKRTVA